MVEPIARLKNDRDRSNIHVERAGKFFVAIFRSKAVFGNEIEENVGIRKISKNRIAPPVAGQNFIVMPNPYFALSLQHIKARYQFIL